MTLWYNIDLLISLDLCVASGTSQEEAKRESERERERQALRAARLASSSPASSPTKLAKPILIRQRTYEQGKYVYIYIYIRNYF